MLWVLLLLLVVVVVAVVAELLVDPVNRGGTDVGLGARFVGEPQPNARPMLPGPQVYILVGLQLLLQVDVVAVLVLHEAAVVEADLNRFAAVLFVVVVGVARDEAGDCALCLAESEDSLDELHDEDPEVGCALRKLIAIEFMQKRSFVGRGPSGNT